jgi:transposase-like protein
MADELRMALKELLVKAATAPDTDVLREGLRVLAEALMEVELDAHVGAGRYERAALGYPRRYPRRAGAAGA